MTTPQDLADRLEKATLREANEARQKEWLHGGIDLSFFGNELAGEVGEACNIIKKLERERLGIRGSRASIAQLAEELADVVICVDLIAMRVGVELDEAVRAKFNATSIKYGLQTRLASLRRSAPASGEMGEAWVAAIDVPKEWEGKLAWRWRDWDQSLGVQQDTIPYNFDRSPGSCRGVYFMLPSRPSSPTPPPPPSGETREEAGS